MRMGDPAFDVTMAVVFVVGLGVAAFSYRRVRRIWA